MSWGNVRASIVSTIEALTPTTKARGGETFRHVSTDTVDDGGIDRFFAVIMTSPPSYANQVTTTTSRWLTSFDVEIYYSATRLLSEDEDRIAEDIVQITEALLTRGNHHANVMAVVPSGAGFTSSSISRDEEGNAVVRISMTLNHV